jgi:thiol-disulfide isomerase/thioredoxin
MKFIIFMFLFFSQVSRAEEFSADVFKGQVLYIDFWASWCGPCKESFPWLNQIQEKYKAKGLTIVGVNLDKDKTKADDFLKTNPALFKIFYNADGSLAKKFGVKGMPYSVILDRNGKIIHTHIGFHTDKTSEYIKTIEGALK